MIEIVKKYNKDLGDKIPESLFLIDKYKFLLELTKKIKKYDNCK